jgi:hypothetical protein
VTTEPADVELTRLRILVASMQPVVNAASVFVRDFQSDAVCGDSEDASFEALIEAVDGYRRELAAIDLARGAT